VRPTLGQHFDPALIDPVHEHKIVRHSVVICQAFATKSVVSERCRNPVPLLLSLTRRPGSLRAGIAARGAPEPGAAVRRNRQCAGLGECEARGKARSLPPGVHRDLPVSVSRGRSPLCRVQGRSPLVSTKWSAKHVLSREAPYISQMKPDQAIRARGANRLADSHSWLADSM
jgi:hypothetical protein